MKNVSYTSYKANIFISFSHILFRGNSAVYSHLAKYLNTRQCSDKWVRVYFGAKNLKRIIKNKRIFLCNNNVQTHVLCSIFSFLYLLFFIAIGCARGLKCGSQPVVHAQTTTRTRHYTVSVLGGRIFTLSTPLVLVQLWILNDSVWILQLHLLLLLHRVSGFSCKSSKPSCCYIY